MLRSLLVSLITVLTVDVNADTICHQPAIPENCHVVYESSGPATPGSKVRYQCTAGFLRFGPEERVCEADGSWSHEVPVCAINVARYRPVMLSGSSGNLSVDGDYQTCSRAVGPRQAQGWWDVDLLRPFQVFAVQVVYKTKGDTQLKDLEIFVGNEAVTDSGKRVVCQKSNVLLDPTEAHTFVCAGQPVGTHVTLKTSQSELLNLCEVMVLTQHSASYWQCGSMTGTVAWGAFGDACYHSSLDAQPWFSASTHCQTQQGTLPEHISVAQHRYMVSELSYRASYGYSGYWLGLVSDAVGRWVYPSNGFAAKDTFWDNPANALPDALGKIQTYAAIMGKDVGWAWTPFNQQAWNYWICKADILYCGSPGVPENGGVILSSQTYSPGVEAYYYCRNGFVVRGAETRTCMTNGTWSGKSPLCKPVVCGGLPILANGLTTHVNESTVLGSQVSFECRHGFKLHGSVTRSCLPTGLWSGRHPSCIEIDCGLPEEPMHGDFRLAGESGSTKLDAEVEYFCSPGFKLIGEPIRTCLEDGQWIPRTPVCVDVNTLKAAIAEQGSSPELETTEAEQTGTKQLSEGLTNQATNLIASFIAVVVVMIVAISIIILWVWKRRKSPEVFPASNSTSGRSSANDTSLSSREILYAFTSGAKNGGAKESVYQLTSDPQHYDPAPGISFISESNIYASPTTSPSDDTTGVSPQPLYYSTINPQDLSKANHQKLVLLLTDENMLKRLQYLPTCATLPKHLSKRAQQLADSDSGNYSSEANTPIDRDPSAKRNAFLTMRAKPDKASDRRLPDLKAWLPSNNTQHSSVQFQQPREGIYEKKVDYGTTRSRKDISRPKIPPPPVPDPAACMQRNCTESTSVDEPGRCETPDSQLFNFSEDDGSDGEHGCKPSSGLGSHKLDPATADKPTEAEEIYDLPPGEYCFRKSFVDNIYEELPRGSLSLPAHLSKANVETDYTVC